MHPPLHKKEVPLSHKEIGFHEVSCRYDNKTISFMWYDNKTVSVTWEFTYISRHQKIVLMFQVDIKSITCKTLDSVIYRKNMDMLPILEIWAQMNRDHIPQPYSQI